MKHGIISNMCGSLIVTVIDFLIGSRSSCNKFLIHISLQVMGAIALYSALALNLATILYFLLLQVTTLPQTWVQYPTTDLLSVEGHDIFQHKFLLNDFFYTQYPYQLCLLRIQGSCILLPNEHSLELP